MSKTCRNPECKQQNPQPDSEYYAKSGKCKSCRRAYQKAYRRTGGGIAANQRYSKTPERLAGHRQAQANYRAKGKHSIASKKWRMHKIVNRDTLREGIPFNQCTNCHENRPEVNITEECPMMNGAEDIKLCLVYQDWKHSGLHPLKELSEDFWDDYPYDPDLEEF